MKAKPERKQISRKIDKYWVPMIAKTIDLLDCFGSPAELLTLEEIVRKTGIPHTTRLPDAIRPPVQTVSLTEKAPVRVCESFQAHLPGGRNPEQFGKGDSRSRHRSCGLG